MKVAVIGTTSWGTTLAVMLARRGIEVSLWARSAEEAEMLRRDGENKARLSGVPFPEALTPVNDIADGLRDAAMVILAVPSQEMRSNVNLVKGGIVPGAIVLSAAKGFELDTGYRMTQVIGDELGKGYGRNICTLSGPNLSREIAMGLPAASVVAAYETAVSEAAREIMHSPTFHVYTSDDVVGVELGGALKNIVALGAGMVDGLGYGDNAKAAYMSHGLSEIAKLGVALGANPITFLGLAGLGDLLATCDSALSRNHTLGEGIARGYSLDEMLNTIGSAVEGVPTTTAALRIAHDIGVRMPIAERIYGVLHEGLDPAKAMAELIGDLNYS